MIPSATFDRLADEAVRITPQHLGELSLLRRHATLAAAAIRLEESLTDATLTMFDKLIGSMTRRAENRTRNKAITSGLIPTRHRPRSGRFARCVPLKVRQNLSLYLVPFYVPTPIYDLRLVFVCTFGDKRTPSLLHMCGYSRSLLRKFQGRCTGLLAHLM